MILSAMNIGEAGLIAVLGWGVVFLGLIALLLVVSCVGLFFKKKQTEKRKKAAAVWVKPLLWPVRRSISGRSLP